MPEAPHLHVNLRPHDHRTVARQPEILGGSPPATSGHRPTIKPKGLRLEVRVMFEELIPRLSSLEITGPVERLRSNFINGIKHMPVRVTLTDHEG